jgi:hypothetical protein
MPDNEIGVIELNPSTKIVFGIGTWQGRRRGSFRKFLVSNRYTGPTPSGLSLDGAVLSQLLVAVKKLAATVPSGAETVFANVGKNAGSEIRVTILPPGENNPLPNVDIREYIEAVTYTGPTKKGVRFPWDKLRQFNQLLEVLVHNLGAVVEGNPTLIPDAAQTNWVEKASQERTSGTQGTTHAIEGFDAAALKSFPDAFLPDGQLDVEHLKLPPNHLKITQDRNGHFFVTDDSGFHRQVRNEVEGKYFLYAQQRGHTELRLPKEMFKVFSAVAGYEKYSRELRQKLIRDFDARSRNRTLAEHMAQETMQTHGLPIC